MLAFYTRAVVDIKWDSYQLQEELARVRCPLGLRGHGFVPPAFQPGQAFSGPLPVSWHALVGEARGSLDCVEEGFEGGFVLEAGGHAVALLGGDELGLDGERRCHLGFSACRKPSDAKYAATTKAIQLTHAGID